MRHVKIVLDSISEVGEAVYYCERNGVTYELVAVTNLLKMTKGRDYLQKDEENGETVSPKTEVASIFVAMVPTKMEVPIDEICEVDSDFNSDGLVELTLICNCNLKE